MVETFASRAALAASMPPVAIPTEHVELRLLYDPFQPQTVEKHKLDFRNDGTLADYLGDLPEDAEYMVFHNGEEVELDSAADIEIARGDMIGVILLPLGGGGLKSILKVVMMVAMIGVFFIPGIGQLAAASIALGLGLVGAFLMQPKMPKSQDEGERTYGIDGAKNSATEGIPYPVIYGEFRFAGNYANAYTENVGDNQYLYLRSVMNDGEIDSISDIEINEQPLNNFRDVQTRIEKGTLTDPVNDWFRSSIRQINKGAKLETSWTTHVTTTEVDQVRFDITFPAGLVSISEKKGKYSTKSVTFEMEYRRVNQDGSPLVGSEGQWTTVPTSEPRETVSNPFGTAILQLAQGLDLAQVEAIAPATIALTSSQPPAVEYRPVGAQNWALAFEVPVPVGSQGFVPDAANDGTIAGPTNITPLVSGEGQVTLDPAVDYEFRGVNGAQVANVVAYPESGISQVKVSDSRTRAIRRSFTSARLARGFYEVRIRRTTPTSTDSYEIDECVLTDISEIEADPVAMRGTANLSLRVKLNDQLNAIPQLTSKVKGSVIQEYDREGNKTVRRWSANPAWIGLDVLCGVERGAGVSLARIDWPRWVEFAEYCDANQIYFNGAFAEGSNIGDVLRQVLRIGHAAPIPFGTKISVAIDRQRDPVTVFTQASMVEKTFSITYTSMQDRANEFEVTYYDNGDRNKAKTIRYVDPKAVAFNEMPRSANLTLAGVDNLAQAKIELWRAIYQNRLLIRQVQFETFMEAINLSLGEVALVQHDQVEWANSGRLRAGNTTTTLKLDQPVTKEDGEYSALVHFSALRRMPFRDITSIVGNKILFAGSALTADQLKSTRLIASNGSDFEIVKLESGSTFHTATLSSPPTGVTADRMVELWQTDVVEERPVASVTQNADGTSDVTLSSALPEVPDQYANFVYGRVQQVRKPYTLIGVSGTGVEKRKLTLVEYHDAVYGPPEVDIPIPVQQVNDRTVEHVRTLLFDYDRIVEANRKTTNVRIFWSPDGIRNYGGADIYMRLNGAEWTAIGSAVNVSEFNVQLTPGDEVAFKVNAYSTRGDRAAITTAPQVAGTLTVERATLDPPTAFSAVLQGFQADGTIAYAFTEPQDTSGIEGYEIEVRHVDDANWFALGRFTATTHVQTGVPPGSYIARVRAISTDSSSIWVETGFTVTVLPGSLLDNFNNGNDRNATPILAPSLPPVGSVEHALNSDSSANLSLEWLWGGNEAQIDGFRITITQS